MRTAVLFVFISFLFIKGYDYFITATHHSNLASVTHLNIKKTQQSEFESVTQGYPIIKDASAHTNEEYLVINDSEVEDTNTLLARKCRLLAECYLTPSGLSLLSYFHSRFTVSQPFCGHLSDKYILQRVLRI